MYIYAYIYTYARLPISSLYHCFFLKWWLQPQPRSSILSHPVVNNSNSWNPYIKIKSFAELYEHECQNNCCPCEDWNGQKWCNQIWPVRSILHLPVLHAFYSLHEQQLKILDIQANKPGNPILLYSCSRCLLDNNLLPKFTAEAGLVWPASLCSDAPFWRLTHVRGLSDLRFADIHQYLKHCTTVTRGPLLLQLPNPQPAAPKASRTAGCSAEAWGRQRERKHTRQLCLQSPSSPFSSHRTADTAKRHPARTAGSNEAQKENKKKAPLLVSVKWVGEKKNKQNQMLPWG